MVYFFVGVLQTGLCLPRPLRSGDFFSSPRQVAPERPVYFGALFALTRRRGVGKLGAGEDRRVNKKKMGANKTMRPAKAILLAFSLVFCGSAFAEPSMTGQTGLIFMPDARIDPDGTWRTGYSYTNPYRALWTSLSVLPRLETSFRYTETDGVPAFSNIPGADFGDTKDKAFDFKVLLTKESRWWPSLVVGAQDLRKVPRLFARPMARWASVWVISTLRWVMARTASTAPSAACAIRLAGCQTGRW